MIMKNPEYNQPESILTALVYHPYRGGYNPKFDDDSRFLLDLKNDKDSAVDRIYNWLEPIVDLNVALAVVPSHDPNKMGGGVYRIAKRLVASNRRVDAVSCLQRHSLIQKLAHGGPRGIDVHINSIRVVNPEFIKDREVLLLDDIKTSGNSLWACKQLLLRAGAREVQCLAFGRTEG
ncbi:ComF family protein [Paenibacillus taichungensis]